MFSSPVGERDLVDAVGHGQRVVVIEDGETTAGVPAHDPPAHLKSRERVQTGYEHGDPSGRSPELRDVQTELAEQRGPLVHGTGLKAVEQEELVVEVVAFMVPEWLRNRCPRTHGQGCHADPRRAQGLDHAMPRRRAGDKDEREPGLRAGGLEPASKGVEVESRGLCRRQRAVRPFGAV
ncbi:MAG: hypothetical protein EXR76_02945 [Myxococcales bacterium]|nr:hypothetical protein [Myxococcales bacterium]